MRILALVLLGCRAGETDDEGAYFTGDWSCEYQPWEWLVDPVQALLEADESGAFDYDPPGDVVTGRTGAYDFETGDLSWSSRYADAYYIEEGSAEGYGTIYDNGDLDLLYLTRSLDVLGEETWSRARIERTGCQSTSSSWEVDAEAAIDEVPSSAPTVVESTIVSDDRVEASFSFDNDGEQWGGTRVATSDLVVVSDYGSPEGDVQISTTIRGDGTGEGSQFSTDGDFDQFVDVAYRVDGSRGVVSEVYEAGTESLTQSCAYELSYAGVGQGSCSFYQGGDTIECDLEFDDSSCVLDCGADGSFDC